MRIETLLTHHVHLYQVWYKSHNVILFLMIGYNLKRNDNRKENGIKNFVDMQAITILLYITGNPKTRSEILEELHEIPKVSIYRKIGKLEKFGLIRKIILPHKKRKKNNAVYESTDRRFVIRNRGKTFNVMF